MGDKKLAIQPVPSADKRKEGFSYTFETPQAWSKAMILFFSWILLFYLRFIFRQLVRCLIFITSIVSVSDTECNSFILLWLTQTQWNKTISWSGLTCRHTPDYLMLMCSWVLPGAASVTLCLADPLPALSQFWGCFLPPSEAQEGIFKQKMGHNFPPLALQMLVG